MYMKGTFRWFILIFIGLWVVWLMTGGPERYQNKHNQFIEPPKEPGGATPVYNVKTLQKKLGN